jgi:hypothetical protein
LAFLIVGGLAFLVAGGILLRTQKAWLKLLYFTKLI